MAAGNFSNTKSSATIANPSLLQAVSAPHHDLVLEQIKRVSNKQIEEMKEIANELNYNFQKQMAQEKEQRILEFKKFKRE